MKTQMMITKIFKVLGLVALTLTLANCAKSDGGSGTTAAVNTYQISGGKCYSRDANGNLTQVDYANCNTTGTITYEMISNICYQVQGTVRTPLASTAQCLTNGTGTCDGQYFTMNNMIIKCQKGSGTGTYAIEMINGYQQYVLVRDCTGQAKSDGTTCQ